MRIIWAGVLVAAAVWVGVTSAAAADLDARRFADPPATSRPTMLWFWNGPMTEQLVDTQLAAMRAEGIGEVVIFPYQPSRVPVPPTPEFFSEEWFDLVGHALREAARTDMKVWLFNDNWYSSGRAGGIVVDGGRVGDRTYEPHPELRPKSLARSTITATGPSQLDVRESWPGVPPRALSIEDGLLLVDGGDVTLLRGGEDWTDYTASFDTRPLATASAGGVDYAQAGWVFRAEDRNNLYAWLLGNYPHSTGPKGNLTKVVIKDGRSTVTRVPVPFDVVAGRSYHVETRVAGDRIETLVDGSVVDVTQDDTLAAGTIGFRQHEGQNESATFDNVKVVGSDGTTLYEETFDSDDALRAFGEQVGEDAVVAVSAVPLEGEEPVEDLTQRFRDGEPWQVPAGEHRIEYFTSVPRSDFGQPGYLDLLSDEAIERYIDVVYEEYHRRFGWAFGNVLRGFWDDEPQLSVIHGGTPAWSDGVPRELAALGTSPAEALPGVYEDLGRAGRLGRGAYWRAVTNRFADAYYRQQGKWAERHGVEFISNPLGDNAPPAAALDGAGSNSKNHQWAQVPGGDAIFGRLVPGTRSAMKGRYAASSAHQNGHERVLNENFGGHGWGVTPEVARYVNGYLALRGVNLTVLHAYWSSDDDAALVHPPPFDPRNSWWPAVDGVAEWTGRVMEANLGRAKAPTAVLQPQRAVEAWYTGQDGDLRYGGPVGDRIDRGFMDVVEGLEDVQVDFDLLDEPALDGDLGVRRQAFPHAGALRIGSQAYRMVVIPPAPTMSLETVERLARMARTGGAVIAYGELPTEETNGRDAALRMAVAELFGTDPADPRPAERRVGAGSAAFADTVAGVQRLAREAEAPAAELTPASDKVRVLRRVRGDDRVFMVMNEGSEAVETSASFPVAGTPELWDPDDGSHRVATRFHALDGGDATAVDLRLEPYEIVAVVFRDRARVPHLLRSALEATSVERARGDDLEARVVADRAGEFPLLGADGARRYAGTLRVSGSFEPIALDGDWGFRFEGGEWSERPLGSWTQIDPGHSGTATYRKTVDIDAGELATGRRLVLDLGDVRDVAEVSVNGERAGRLLWKPYRLDVTGELGAGENVIEVAVTNTPANEHGSAQSSGLLGPVVLRPQRELKARLQRLRGPSDEEIVLSAHPRELRLLPCGTAALAVTVTNHSLRTVRERLTARADGPIRVAPPVSDLRLRGEDSETVSLAVDAPAGAPGGEYAATLELGDRGVAVPVSVPANPDLADGGTATASSTHPSFSAANAIDGDADSETWGSANGWNDGTSRQFPDWLQVDLACQSPVGRVDVHTLDSARYPAPRYGARDYDVQTRVDGSWRTVAEVRGNTAGTVSSAFDAVTTDAMRVLVHASNDATSSRIVELDVFGR